MTRSTLSLVVSGLIVSLAAATGPIAAAQQMGVPADARRDPNPGIQQDEPAGSPEALLTPPKTYGTTAWIVSPVNSFTFVPFDPSTQYGGDGANGRYTVSGPTCYEAAAILPTGALVTGLGMDWCDTSNSDALTATLFVCGSGACTIPYSLTTSGLANGCWVSTATGGTGAQVNNNAYTYTVQVCTGGTGSSLLFRTARVFYSLQVSPAPATATFTDVPTSHGFFRFVEALAAAGITGGCGGGNFCPDSPLTRGQMAVFLATALGLHFPY